MAYLLEERDFYWVSRNGYMEGEVTMGVLIVPKKQYRVVPVIGWLSGYGRIWGHFFVPSELGTHEVPVWWPWITGWEEDFVTIEVREGGYEVLSAAGSPICSPVFRPPQYEERMPEHIWAKE